MTPIKAVKNQFLGINPLLHSHLQSDGHWNNFHINHISDLTRFLQRDLRPLGYLAQTEQSLQIRRLEDPAHRPESDISIYDPKRRPSARYGLSGGLAHSLPELLMLDEEDIATYRAVGIYEKKEDGTRGDAVAWLELLSPANKPEGRHFLAYRDKRADLLQTGLVFIELDYLNHQPPTVATPLYPNEDGSSSYRIVIIDPRPEWLSGEGRVYPINVDEKLPKLTIPLNADDVVQFDFDAPYQQTYEALFFGDGVDYSELPVEWNRYSADDQARILSRLLAIRGAAGDLEKPPVPITALSLDDAQRQWNA